MRLRLGVAVILVASALWMTGCSADKSYRLGKKAEAGGQYEEALQYFESALYQNPNKAEYYLEKGMTLIAMERFTEAREALLSAINDNSMELVRRNNKCGYYGIGITYYEEGAYEMARDYFEMAAQEELLPDWNMEIYRYLTEVCDRLGDKEATLAYYDLWLNEEIGNATDFHKRAYLRMETLDYEGSLKDFNEAIKKEPEVFAHYYGKYEVLCAMENTEDAQKVLKAALKLENLNEQELFFVAKEQFLAGEYDKAQKNLEISVKNGFVEAEYMLAEILYQRGDYEAAAKGFCDYLEKNNMDGYAYARMAFCLAELGRYENALEATKEGLKVCVADNEIELLYNQVVIYERMGEFQTAYEYALRYSSRFPEDERLQKELAFLSSRAGKK